MANFDNLTAAINALAAQATTTVGVEDSAEVLINGFAAQVTAAVTAALEADNAADQGSIDVAVAAISNTRDQFNASSDKLGAAVAANPGPTA